MMDLPQFSQATDADPVRTNPSNGKPSEQVENSTVVTSPAGGRRLGRYVSRSFHARGGMGEVWLFHDGTIGREVALKMLRRDAGGARERFLAEAQITGQLEHPGIVPVHDFGIDDSGQPFYVMKFVRGRTLKQAIADYHAPASKPGEARQLQFVRLLQVFVDLCHAAAYAHSRGVVHRDIKPDNVMLGPYGETLLLDWGIAKLLGAPENSEPPSDASGASGQSGTGWVHASSGASSQTGEGTVMGTPSYMAPEMAEGHSERTDQRTDVYLLGSTLYEILTCKQPRQGSSRDEMVELARSVPPPPARKVFPGCSRPLEAVTLKAMSPRREDRYPDAMALAADIERYLAGEPVSACPESVWRRSWRWCRRHRRALMRGAATVLFIALTAATLVTWQNSREIHRREQARADLRDYDRLAEDARFYAASTDAPGEQIPYYDPAKGESLAASAVAVIDKWGDSFQRWPLPEERGRLRNDLYELFLLQAQTRNLRRENAAQTLLVLDRAGALGVPLTSGYYRIRAATCELLGDARGQANNLNHSKDASLSFGATDLFLLGEEARLASSVHAALSTDGDLHATASLRAAADYYRKSLAIDPTYYWSQLQLGRCELALGRGDEALAALGACVAIRPTSPWSYCSRGLALAMLKRYADSERDLDKALELRPGFPPALLDRGVCRWLQHQYSQALGDYDAAINPPGGTGLIEAGYYRGWLLVDQGKFDLAVADFDRFITARPDFAPAYLLRARTHLMLGREADCLNDLDAAPAIGRRAAETEAAAHCRRGHALRGAMIDWPGPAATRAAELARRQLMQALPPDQNPAVTLADLGAVCMKLGEVQQAIEWYSKSLDAAPADAKVWMLRGEAYVASRQYAEGAADFAQAVRLEPSNATAHSWLGYIAAMQSEGDPLREAAQATALGGDDFVVLHNVACIYAQLSRSDGSTSQQDLDLTVAYLQRAVQIWRTRNGGPNEPQLIRDEPAFHLPSLRARDDFRALLQQDK
jgi:serine/threonine protein kinase/tetratricopeptide (TPR) repeat protein